MTIGNYQRYRFVHTSVAAVNKVIAQLYMHPTHAHEGFAEGNSYYDDLN